MNAVVAYAGVPGAFAEGACHAFLPSHEPVPRDSFADVVEAVTQGVADTGMLPLHNETAGPVPGVASLIEAAGLQIEGRHSLPVRMQLAAIRGAAIQSIEVVRSHPMALAQCARALAALGVKQEAAENSATAALRLAESGDRASAVLASERAAKLYGLTILRRDVHDQPDNRTVFGIVWRAPQ